MKIKCINTEFLDIQNTNKIILNAIYETPNEFTGNPNRVIQVYTLDGSYFGGWLENRFERVEEEPAKEKTSSNYTEEVVYRFWNDKIGDRLEVSDDGDGLDLIEIRMVFSDGKTGQSITLSQEQAAWLAQVLPKKVNK